MTDARERVTTTIRAANAEGRAALLIYLPAGYPDLPGSRDRLEAAAEGGADLLEVGFPYSDPVMDGPAIQAANQVALDAGLTPADDLAMCRELNARVDVPTLVMTYYNLLWHYPGTGTHPADGAEDVPPGSAAAATDDETRLGAFARAAAEAGLAGAIVPDLPAGEGGPWARAAAAHHLATVFLVAPATGDGQLAAAGERTTGFVYASSTMGVTGERTSLADTAAPLVDRVRGVTDRPVCVGLGVSTREQAAEVAGFADGVIVGSAAVRAAKDGPHAVRDLVSELAAGCRQGGGAAVTPDPG
ncbi:tryptophan synthase subunit alpha [Egibacter rhizosphaerae]|uniref:Tryptophan synthase alpha chain n=1 Tax=Egibacter rhizosphaerae TaxID=1670831 RepID=A0A411YKQ1_9ACTN|nr:tryptophan synthase subunit alpha [Egibacter rhizosphaerae]QBI21798.1 tryptophan synthase subunit alpha [Egibacter rhizosphaerae]